MQPTYYQPSRKFDGISKNDLVPHVIVIALEPGLSGDVAAYLAIMVANQKLLDDESRRNKTNSSGASTVPN